MLCAQHALNNLLQASLFTPQDLADMARQLDALEAEQLDDVPAGFGTGESPNYDDSGFFSIMGESTPLPVSVGGSCFGGSVGGGVEGVGVEVG